MLECRLRLSLILWYRASLAIICRICVQSLAFGSCKVKMKGSEIMDELTTLENECNRDSSC
jgi:hypothetical protein